MASTQFVTFGLQHLVATGLVVGGSAALVVGVRRAGSARLDRAMRWALAAACVGFEASDLVSRATAPGALWQDALPLHLCDLTMLLAPVVLLGANRHAFELLYFWGLGGAAQSLATPTLYSGFPAPICVCFFVGHGLIIASALYAAAVLRRRPGRWAVPRVWGITVAYGLLVLPVNLALGTNYLYIAHKPPTPSLLDWLGPWPWYLLSLQPVIVLVLVLCQLPFLVASRRSRSHAAGP